MAKTKTSKSKLKCGVKGKISTRLVDVVMLKQLVLEKGYTIQKFSSILGISPSIFWKWENLDTHPSGDTVKRIADFLGVDEETLYRSEDNVVDEVTEVTTVTDTTDISNIDNVFKEIGETQNVHVQFDTVNSNVILLANVLKEYIDEKFDILTAKMDVLSTELSEYYQRLELSIDNGKLKPKPQAYFINRVEVNKLITGYNENDDYEKYRDKINRMVSVISSVTKAPHKNILHGFYIDMTNTYGVVYDQCKKEYFEKYQHTDSGSTELLYENPIFKQIFYNVISDELKRVTKDMK